MVKIRVPASSANLGPGFDTLALALGLYNFIEVAEAKTFSLCVKGEESEYLPANKENLLYKSIVYFYQQVGKKIPPLKILMENQIPLARGLGSSAATIVAGLMVANLLNGATLSKEEIFPLAVNLEGHADNVAAALFGGLTISYQEGRDFKAISLRPSPKIKAIILLSDGFLSTKKAREVLPKRAGYPDVVFNLGRLALLLAGFLRGKQEYFFHATQDRLHQPFREKLLPGFSGAVKICKEAGLSGVALSGAGPSLIAFTTKTENIIGKLKQGIKKAGLSYRPLLLKIDLQGAKILEGKM